MRTGPRGVPAGRGVPGMQQTGRNGGGHSAGAGAVGGRAVGRPAEVRAEGRRTGGRAGRKDGRKEGKAGHIGRGGAKGKEERAERGSSVAQLALEGQPIPFIRRIV